MRRLYALVIILAVAIAASAQNNVKIAQDKIKKDGVIVYVHNVQQSETLYSISKAYNVSIKEIIENNPVLGNGLKTGMILYIPDKLSPGNSDEKSSGKQESKRKRRLSRQERIAIALRRSNEEAESKENITASNGKDKVELPTDSTTLHETENVTETVDQFSTNENLTADMYGRKADIALILPFNSRDTSNLNSNFMDFYAGSLLALDSLSSLGVDVTLDVIDQKDYSSLDDIGRSGRLVNKGIVIGPVKKGELETIHPYIESHTILVSPMDHNAASLVSHYNGFVQIPTDLKHQLNSIVDNIADKYSRSFANVVIIYESGNTDSLYVNSIARGLTERHIGYSSLHYNILEGRAVEDRIKNLLRDHIMNIVIVPSNNEAFVSDAIRNLSLLNTEERPIMLFGMPKWKNFEVLDIYLLHQLNLHLSLPYYVDYDNPQTKSFVERYKALYNTYPTPYAFQGYDIVFYMAYARLMGDYNAIQSNFAIRSNFGHYTGFFNTGTKNIVYNKDFTISVEN